MTDNKVDDEVKVVPVASKVDQTTGMPIISDEDKEKISSPKNWIGGFIFGPLVGFAVGFGVGQLIFAFGDNEMFVAKILAINAVDF